MTFIRHHQKMNRPFHSVICCLYSSLLISFVSFSQSNSDFKALELYDTLIGQENTGLYNGLEFKAENIVGNEVSRYFNQNSFVNSTLKYKGQLYAKVPLEYDILTDNVLTRSYDQKSSFVVQLIPEYVTHFTIDGHRFVRLTDARIDFDGNGFYEVASIKSVHSNST